MSTVWNTKKINDLRAQVVGDLYSRQYVISGLKLLQEFALNISYIIHSRCSYQTQFEIGTSLTCKRVNI